MLEIVLTRELAAPAERTWAVVTDLDRWPEVLEGVGEIERLDGGSGFAAGTRWRETRIMFSRDASEEMTVIALDEGKSYRLEAESNGAHYISTMRVEPLGPNRSQLTTTFHVQPATFLGKIMAATVGRLFTAATRRSLERDLADIAAAVEAGATPGSG